MTRKERLLDVIELGFHGVEELQNGQLRVGYCCDCGKCCMNLDIRVPMSSSVEEWIGLYEHLTVTRLSEKLCLLSINSKCSNLQQNTDLISSKTVYFCKDYENRPAPCKLYPPSPSKFEECTYYFLNGMEVDWFRKQCELWRQKNGKET